MLFSRDEEFRRLLWSCTSSNVQFEDAMMRSGLGFVAFWGAQRHIRHTVCRFLHKQTTSSISLYMLACFSASLAKRPHFEPSSWGKSALGVKCL